MTLLLCGFLIKGAVVPFHLWAADAYAVAPAPVCAVLGGVMTDIGLIGVARLYWTVFDAPFGRAHAVGDVLLWLGIVTAVLAGTMAFLQRHLKRMLAYSVVCHIGIMLAGIGLLELARARRRRADVPGPRAAHRGALLRRRDPPRRITG